MPTVRREVLRKAFDRIIAKMEDENVTEVQINTDWYRIITADQWDNFTPKEDLAVTGSLNDDLEELEKMVNEPDRPCTYVDFDRLASLLHALSQENNPA